MDSLVSSRNCCALERRGGRTNSEGEEDKCLSATRNRPADKRPVRPVRGGLPPGGRGGWLLSNGSSFLEPAETELTAFCCLLFSLDLLFCCLGLRRRSPLVLPSCNLLSMEDCGLSFASRNELKSFILSFNSFSSVCLFSSSSGCCSLCSSGGCSCCSCCCCFSSFVSCILLSVIFFKKSVLFSVFVDDGARCTLLLLPDDLVLLVVGVVDLISLNSPLLLLFSLVTTLLLLINIGDVFSFSLL